MSIFINYKEHFSLKIRLAKFFFEFYEDHFNKRNVVKVIIFICTNDNLCFKYSPSIPKYFIVLKQAIQEATCSHLKNY